MTQLWTIIDAETGTMLCPAFATASYGQHPRFAGWDWDAERHFATRIDTAPDETVMSWIDGAWADDLGKLQALAVARVDAEAEAARCRFLTPGTGQAMTYQRKEAEARAWLAGDGAATPFLSAEAAARGMPVATLAAEVAAQADAWESVGATIEGLRMGAKAGIATADTREAIDAAAEVSWPS